MLIRINELTIKQIAEMTHKSQSYIWNILQLEGSKVCDIVAPLPKPIRINGDIKYYDDKGLEMIKNFLEKVKNDKMAKRIVHYYIQNKNDGDLF